MTCKSEALTAISHARDMLAKPDGWTPGQGYALSGLQLVQLKGFLDYAAEQVEAVQELKRVRKAKA